MPELGRAGLAGVGMITCVNPQIDDYDETISILANASLACKIKEIAEVGRSMNAFAIGTALASTATATTTTATTTTAHHLPHRQTRTSVITIAAAGKRKREQKASDASSDRSSDGSKVIPLHAATSTVIPPPVELPTQSNNNDEPESKRLRVELDRLQEENIQLRTNQMLRETELREEISKEMAKRSHKLLIQIQDLREQLEEKDRWEQNVVTKSCKKVKRKHLEQMTDQSILQNRETEEEFEQMKSNYESEITQLKAEKKSLQQEVDEWKSRAEVSMRSLEILQNAVARDLSPTSLKSVAGNCDVSSAAYQRNQDSKRAKPRALSPGPMPTTKRSPLSTLKRDATINSSPALNNANNNGDVIKRSNSPGLSNKNISIFIDNENPVKNNRNANANKDENESSSFRQKMLTSEGVSSSSQRTLSQESTSSGTGAGEAIFHRLRSHFLKA